MALKIVAWLFGTPLGRGVVLGGSLVIGFGLAWLLFSSHYDKRGYQRCKAEQAQALAEENARVARENLVRDALSAQIGQDTASRTASGLRASDRASNTSKENINNAYRNPPRTAPVSPGSCVHPVDAGVQQEIERAVNRANRGS